ncbi:MAG: hypothetical protein AAB215_07315, partial [Planctomycetota bacterium]
AKAKGLRDQVELVKQVWDLKVATQEFELLKRNLELDKRRSEVVDELKKTRILWSKKLLQFAQLMNQVEFAWVDRLSIEQGGLGYLFKIQCYTSSEGTDSVAQFLTHLSSDPQFKDIFVRDPTDLEKLMINRGTGFSTELYRVPVLKRGGRRFNIELEVDTKTLRGPAKKAAP